MRNLAVSLLLSATLLSPLPALAQDAGGLAVVAAVNDEAVSSLDVENRLKLVLATTRLSDTPEVRERLRPQILRSLVIETLQNQEARKNGITVRQPDIDEAIATLEQQRNIPPGGLLTRLDEMHVPRSTFINQVSAQLAWSKLVMQKIRPRIKISEDELDRERAKAQTRKGDGEVEIELLGLPVDRPENEAQMRSLAEKLAAEIRGGAPFESVAGELGNASGVAQIKPVWLPLNQLDPVIASAIGNAKPGDIADPVRTPEGYTIVKLLNRRSNAAASATITEVVLKDILMALKNDAGQGDVEASLAVGRELAHNPGDCSSPTVAGVENLKDYDITVQFRRENEQSLSPALQEIVSKLRVGGVSEPVASPQGIRLFMLCERVDAPAPLADREETLQRVMQQKLELEAQKYLRNLRRDAYIELR